MRIRVELNKNSIKKAQQDLKNITKKIDEILINYCRASLIRISEIANENLDNSSLGFNSTEIRTSWEIGLSKNPKGYMGYKLYNTTEEALWAEFGTGIKGSQDKHKMADLTGYQYANYTWTFANQIQGLYLENFEGYVGHEFLYKAMNSYMNSGEYKSVWETILRSYL